MSNIQLKNLTKKYGSFNAVDSINLSIKNGEFVTLLGPSGCGKTTTLRMVAGFIKPTSGDLIIGGSNMVGVPPQNRKVGLVFQNYALFPHMSVRKNVAFGLKMKKMQQSLIAEKVNKILETVQLQELSERMPSELSGGQQQRVALARALVIEPEVLLLDEPFGALDKNLRDHMRIELRDLQRKLNISTIFVTHDQDEALSMSDRIVVMENGKICQIGSPSEIYENPASVFVAGFLGLSNIFSAVCTKIIRAKKTIEFEGLTIEIESEKLNKSDKISIMIRPENIQIYKKKNDSKKEDFLGFIKSKIYLGSTIQYQVKIKDGPVILINANNSKILNFQDFDTNEEVRVHLSKNAIYPII